jgi:hypothetical protein
LERDGHDLLQGYPVNRLQRLNKTMKTSFRIADNSQDFIWIPPEQKFGVLSLHQLAQLVMTSSQTTPHVMDLLEEAMCLIYIAGQAKSNKNEEWAEEFLFSRHKINII